MAPDEVWANNLKDALDEAIRSRTKEEQQKGFTTDSSMLAGWKDLYEKIKAREITAIYLKYS
jgi:hypothetical protein